MGAAYGFGVLYESTPSAVLQLRPNVFVGTKNCTHVAKAWELNSPTQQQAQDAWKNAVCTGLRLACESWALPLVLLVPQLDASILICPSLILAPSETNCSLMQLLIKFLDSFPELFPPGFPEKHCSREEWEWGKEEQARFPLITALRAAEMFKRGRWDELSLWWPCWVHHNCSLKSVCVCVCVKFSVKIFPVGVPGSNSHRPPFSPTITDFLWSLEHPDP